MPLSFLDQNGSEKIVSTMRSNLDFKNSRKKKILPYFPSKNQRKKNVFPFMTTKLRERIS